MTAKRAHTVVGDNSMRCLNCGEDQPIAMPISIGVFAAMGKAFAGEHAHCKPSERGRARFAYTTPAEWLASWDTGASSLTIYNFMMHGGNGTRPRFGISTPQDPDDFGRCHRLLKAFPQWRERLTELGLAIDEWAPLTAHWQELEKLFEEKSPNLYTRLQELR